MPKIHIIEDNKLFSDMLKKRLERKGFEVTQTFSIDSNIPKADLYVVDIHLDEFAFDVIEKISKTPTIVLSAYNVDSYKTRAFDAWALVYKIKWESLNVIIAQIKSILNYKE